jgi:hypothetical protein
MVAKSQNKALKKKFSLNQSVTDITNHLLYYAISLFIPSLSLLYF